ncbi:hypothetical protein HNQ51_000659 [Inhella inkyongensis]|uniref:Solute-binding protein family 3/N-terminal domain-containing protein n=1 Tax=Inhella inkyongensis TaxID=392593 RepID=A0A840S2Q6_9BURK|nr:hypothetical protein [Inhella inkyongensis]MBB5203366.1 hypothetical protein [Inhella inkyongensis]
MLRRDLLMAGPAFCAGAAGATAAGDLGRLRYPRVGREVPEDELYPWVLLRAALAASGVTFRLEPSSSVMVQSRFLRELEIGSGEVDVGWTMTSAERERSLLPVRVPIFRGLYGWRLLFLRPGMPAVQREALARARTVKDLQPFRFVQGEDWADTQVLRANGLNVLTSTHHDHLFSLLAQGKADLFPRAAAEIWWEKDRRGEALEVEPNLVLRYPAAIYFFVSPGRHALAAALERGLRALARQGEFERLFKRHLSEALDRSGLQQRRVIELHNPLLSPQTPLKDAALWYRP